MSRVAPVSCFSLLFLLVWIGSLVSPVRAQVESVPRSELPDGVVVRAQAPLACFIRGEALKFNVRWKRKLTQQTTPVQVEAHVQAFYSQQQVGDPIRADFDGRRATIVVTDDLPNGPYRLAIKLRHANGKVLARGRTQFALMASPPPKPVDPDREWLAVCAHFLWLPNWLTPHHLDAAQRIGINWIRMNLPPVMDLDVKFAQQRYNRARFIQDQLKTRGMNCMILALGGYGPERDTPAWNTGKFAWSYPPKDWRGWARAVAQQMDRFSPQVRYWELHNEPHGSFLRIEGLEEKYPGSKDQIIARFFQFGQLAQELAEQPGQVVGPAANSWAYDMIDRLTAQHGRFVDVLSAHYNEAPLEVRGGTGRLQRAIDRHFKQPADIWITEANAINGIWGQPDLEYKYRHYLRTWFERLVDRAFPYVLNHLDRGTSWKAAIIDPKYNVPQPGVFLLQAMYQHTRNAQPIGRLFADPRIESYLSIRDGQLMLAAWKNQDNQDHVTLPAELLGPDARVYDLFWNPLPRDSVTLTEAPLFVHGVNPKAEPVTDALVRVNPGIYRLDPGVNNRMTLVLANPGPEAMDYVVRFENPHVQVTPAALERTVNAGQALEIPIRVKRTGGPDGAKPLMAQVNGQSRRVARFYHYDPDDVQTINIMAKHAQARHWRVYPHFQAPDSLGTPRGSFERQLDTVEQMAEVGTRLHGLPSQDWQGPYRHDWRAHEDPPQAMQTIRFVQRPSDSEKQLAEFWADFAQNRKIKWFDASFGLTQRVELPGIPVKCRVRLRALPEHLDGNVMLGVGLRDGNGDLIRFFFENPIVPSQTFREYETTIDSVFAEEKRKAAFGGIAWGLSPIYPMAFEGIGLVTEGPVKKFKDGRWRAGIQIESIEFDYRPADERPAGADTLLIGY